MNQVDRTADPEESLLEFEGDFWTLSHEGTSVRVKHVAGLDYIARLLAEPGRAIHVLDLVEAPRGRPNGSRSLDATENAPGTLRTSASERARARVTISIRVAVGRISARHPSLGYHLATALKTGTFCRYQPHPERPVPWRVCGRGALVTP